MSLQPSHTIYINNLNEKIKKDGKTFFFLRIYMHLYIEVQGVLNITFFFNWQLI